MRAIIVEDEIFSANTLKQIVEDSGVEVVAIVDRVEKLWKALKDSDDIDIVFMDIMLKGSMSGAEAAILLSDKYPEIKIIFLTAYSDKEMLDYACEAKAFAYLLKPYREKEIIAAITLVKSSHKKFGNSNVIKEHIIELKDGFKFDIKNEILYYFDKEIGLTNKMKKLFVYLCKHNNRYISSQELVNYIWQDNRSTDALRSLIPNYAIKSKKTMRDMVK